MSEINIRFFFKSLRNLYDSYQSIEKSVEGQKIPDPVNLNNLCERYEAILNGTTDTYGLKKLMVVFRDWTNEIEQECLPGSISTAFDELARTLNELTEKKIEVNKKLISKAEGSAKYGFFARSSDNKNIQNLSNKLSEAYEYMESVIEEKKIKI